jgi:hypothetical protein
LKIGELTSLIILTELYYCRHPDWKRQIQNIPVCKKPENLRRLPAKTSELVKSGRLPITEKKYRDHNRKARDDIQKLINQIGPHCSVISVSRTEV